MPTGTYTITADSTPDFDSWGYDKYWGCAHWTKWHSLMVEKYGIKYANDKFIEQWEQQTMFAAPADCTTFNQAFIAYAKKYGFYQALFSGIAVLTYPIAIVTDVLFDAGQVIDNATDTAVGVSDSFKDVMKYLVPIAVIGVSAWALNTYVIKPMNLRKRLKAKG